MTLQRTGRLVKFPTSALALKSGSRALLLRANALVGNLTSLPVKFPTSALALKSGSRALLGREIPLGATLHQSQPAISDFLGGNRTQALGEPVLAWSHTSGALAVGVASPCAH